MKKRMFLVLVVLSILPLLVCAQSVKSIMRRGQFLPPQQSIAISTVIEKGYYFATNVSVNGSIIDGLFLIDTGAEYSILSQSIAQQLQIKSLGITAISDGFQSRSDHYGIVDISIDSAHFSQIGVVMVPDTLLGLGVFCDVQGIIGSNILKHAIWHFDLGKLTILKSIDGVVGYKRQPLLLHGLTKGVPSILVGINKPRGTFLFDTGDNGLITINKWLLEHILNKQMIEGTGRAVQTLFGDQNAVDSTSYWACKSDTFYVAGLKLVNPVVNVEDNSEPPVVGNDFFNYFETILDYPGEQFLVKQICAEYPDFKWHRLGMKVVVEGGELFVGFVWKNSNAYRQGVRPGLRIMRINGLDAHHSFTGPSCDLHHLVDGELEKDTVTFEFEGQDKEVLISKAYLFSGFSPQTGLMNEKNR